LFLSEFDVGTKNVDAEYSSSAAMKALSSDSVNMSALCNERSTDFALVKDKETFWNPDDNSSARFRLADA